MKKIIIIIPITIAVAILFYPNTSTSNGSGSPGGKTNSPLDGQNCTGCHSGNIEPNTGNNMGSLTTNIPATGYVIGDTYTITLNGVGGSLINKYGFELTAENLIGKSGSFLITDNTTKLVNNNNAVTHKTSGTSGNNTKSWSMDWTPTANSTNSTTFYAALMLSNGNNNTSGDDVYALSLTVLEDQTTSLFEIQKEYFIFNNIEKTIKSDEPFNLYDLNGKIVLQTKNNITHISDFKAGIYILKTANKTQKLIIN